MLTPSFMIICLSPPFVPLRQKYSQPSYLALSADSSSIYLSRWSLSSNPQLLCPVFVMHCLYSLTLSIPEKFLVLLLGKQPKLSYFSHPFLSLLSIHLFVRLCHVSVTASGVFVGSCGVFHYGTRTLQL